MNKLSFEWTSPDKQEKKKFDTFPPLQEWMETHKGTYEAIYTPIVEALNWTISLKRMEVIKARQQQRKMGAVL